MHVLFLVSFGISLVHIGRHLVIVDIFFAGVQVDPATARAEIIQSVSVDVTEKQLTALPPPSEQHQEVRQQANTPQPQFQQLQYSAQKSFTQQRQHSVVGKVVRPRKPTWALVTPPGLLGGYRNQVIRLFGMVIGASQQKIQQFLLPSILWSTFVNHNQIRSVPMEDIFDIP